MGVAKCHSVTRMTFALKHMMGFLESPSGLHAYLHKGIADINTRSQIKADLHILEALLIRTAYEDYVTCGGPETEETNPCVVKRKNQIIAGIDPVLVDAYACSTFYSVKPRELAHLNNAFEWGIGDLDVEAAKVSGKLRMVNVGELAEVIPVDTPAAAPQEAAIIVENETLKPTAMPLPDNGETVQRILPSTVTQQSCNNAINPNDVLNKALIPASIILAGAGIIAARQKPTDDPTVPENPSKNE